MGTPSDGAVAADLIGRADEAAGAGDLERARALLSEAAALQDGDVEVWLKLAALQRATGQLDAALGSVQSALRTNPLDFTALLMRASLLDRLNDPAAPEAWAHAMAQKPAGTVPPALATVIARGEARIAEWQQVRERQLRDAMRDAEATADEELQHRFERFRNNVLRRARPYHSEATHFHYPGLIEREFHPRRLFPWLEVLEAATETIAAELRAVMSAERAELVPYIQYDAHMPLAQWKPLNKNRDWTAIHLFSKGELIAANAAHCPETMAILATLPQPDIAGAGPNAMFSLLAPHTTIPPHVGVNNARLVCHLPLIVPEGCWFRVGAETRYWQRGQAFVFDDTIEHEALNPTDELRVVFIFDVWHPELAPIERQAITALIEATSSGSSGGL